MAAGNTLATNVAELIPEITLEAGYVYQDASIGRSLVSFQDVNAVSGNTVEFPRFTEVAGSTGAAEAAVPDSHQMDLTNPSLTLAKRNVLVIASGLSVRGTSQNLIGKIGEAMGKAKAKQDDNAIFGILTGTTNWGTRAGATNAALSITHALDGLNLLELNEVDEVINCVVHPFQYKTIRSALTPVANDDGVAVQIASEMARAAFVSTFAGMNWFKTNRIGSGTEDATANVYNGLIFVASGIGYAHAWSPFSGGGIQMGNEIKEDTIELIYNYYDSSGVIHTPGVAKLYSTSA